MKRHIIKSRISFPNGLFNISIFRARMRPNAHVSWQFVLGNLKKVSFLIRKPVNVFFLYVSTYEVEACVDNDTEVGDSLAYDLAGRLTQQWRRTRVALFPKILI